MVHFKVKKHNLTLGSVSLLNNPQNSEFCCGEKYEVDMLKIIIIIIGYTLNNFTTPMMEVMLFFKLINYF
jgi:hypothetical protein